MKKIMVYFLFLVFFVCFLTEDVFAGSKTVLSITGAVKHPLTLSIDDINSCQSICVQLNEINRNGEFKGIFSYQGVPLKTLLKLALIDKGKTDFSKLIDLVILIKNKDGKNTVLSWGEIFYRNPGQIILATSSSPVMPHKDCSNCHAPEVYDPWLSELKRDVGLPKLVVASDIYSDRSLENIMGIEVIDLKPAIKAIKSKELYSPGFTVTGNSLEPVKIKTMSDPFGVEIHANVVGEGKGYHGIRNFKGTPLAKFFKNIKINADLNTVFLISAPDGYRSLLSYGEIFFSPLGERIIIADKVNGQPIKEGGKFCLILPDDLMADRWVKAVQRIDVISIGKTK